MEESKEKEYPFINEIIIPKKKNKWLVRLETLIVVIIMAIVFGFVARGAFFISDDYWKKWLDIEEQQKVESSTGITSENFIVNLTQEQQKDIQVYKIVYDATQNMGNSIVTVKMLRQKIGLFEEPYSVSIYTTGLILSENDTDLLILVNTERILEDDSIKVCFGTTELSGEIYSINEEYGFAIISVLLSSIPKEVLENIIFAQFSEEKITRDARIIAIGRPNGYQNSIEVGKITSLGGVIPVVDGEVPYFITNIVDNKNGSGFIFNLNGQVLGMITHTYERSDTDDRLSSAIILNDIKDVIMSSLNQEKSFVYFGIKGKALPESRKQIKNGTGEIIELESGIYVVEVEKYSTAFYLGMQVGDIILSINGEKLRGMKEFKEILLQYEVGEVIQLEVLGQSQEKSIYYDESMHYIIDVRLTKKK